MMKNIKRTVPSEDIMPKVLKVLDLIVMAIKPLKKKSAKVHDEYSYAASEMHEYKSSKTVGKKCVDLVNQSLCSQRYEEAGNLLSILYQDNSVYDDFLFKATMVVLENLQTYDKEDVIYEFIREIQKLPCVNKKEVMLEYITCILRNNFSNVSCILKEKSVFVLLCKEKFLELRLSSSRKNDTIDPLFEAYSAYVGHMASFANDRIFKDETQASQISELTQIPMDSIISKFKKLIRTPGDWDIFVLKLIEILNECDKAEEIEDVLHDYVESNPNNLNAHIYLCNYLNNYHPESEVLIKHLKVIADWCPSDERVLLLIEKLWNRGKEGHNCLQLSFMFLDYPSNEKNVKAWKLLSDILLKSEDSKRELEKLYWKSRRSSWHWMYFNPSQVYHITEIDLPFIAVKTSVLLFFNKDHEYIKRIQEKFPEFRIT
ncbi:uncharacterized protein CDAR_460121 [Caerostris darwini]|uniref:Uncharacterized protein n=1 Tax=Caerostris darwini TaxID=1538125 RepID=A0AAV4V2E0_9ARAC|nr:uncharacterized protein CDAR_460121 [Caerostris darwini]